MVQQPEVTDCMRNPATKHAMIQTMKGLKHHAKFTLQFVSQTKHKPMHDRELYGDATITSLM